MGDVAREQVGVYDARTSFSALLERAEAGEEIVITRHGVPVAMLGPPPPARKLQLGWAAGRFTVPDDFDDPLPDEHLWYGEDGDDE